MKTYAKLMRMAMCLFIAAVLAVSGVSPSVAGTIYVNQYSAVPGTGTSWANAATNLQYALSLAAAGDQLWVAQGIYYPGTNYSDTFRLKPNVGLYGGFAGNETSLAQQNWQKYVTTLSGEINGTTNIDNIRHVVTAASATNAVLDGFVISRGHSGISHITGLSSEPGSGLYVTAQPVTVRHCWFSGNTSKEGGGISLVNAGATVIRDCRFTLNRVDFNGGGVHCRNAAPAIENSIFYDNVAVSFGGAVYIVSNLTTRLRHCTFVGNQAVSGGSLYVSNQGSVDAKNSIFWNASGTGDQGGGIQARTGTVSTAATLVDVRYSDIKGGFIENGTNTYVTNNIIADPLFANEAGRDLHLQSGSPCVDTGDAADTVTLDFDGVVRPTGAGVDMGAYEYTADVPAAVEPVSGLLVTGGRATITIEWTNPDTTNFNNVLIVRQPEGVAPVGVPGDGGGYSSGDMVGNQTVVYYGSGSDGTPGNISQLIFSNQPPDTAYACAVYAVDRQTNYSIGLVGSAATESAPPSVDVPEAFGGNAQIEVIWQNPSDPEVRGFLVLRQRGVTVENMPEHTHVYQAGDMIGADTVAYVGPGSNIAPEAMSGFVDTNLANSSTYYYRIFAYDSGPNYSYGMDCSADTMSLANIDTLVDGSLDHYFRLTWNNPDEVDFQGVLILRGDANFTAGVPENEMVYAPGDMIGSSKVVYRGPTTNHTPNAGSGWTDPEWFSSGVTRYYTFYAYDSANKYGRPVANLMATTLADTTAPDPVTGLSGTPSLGYNTLGWVNPNAVDFTGLLVVRDTEPITWLPTPGASYLPGSSVGSVYVVYIGPGNNGAVPGVANDTVDNQNIADGVTYYYRVCSTDGDKNYSTPVDTSVQVPSAGKIFVNDDAAGLNNGRSWANAFTNLQSAFTNWVDGKQIWVAAGVYVPGTSRTDQFTFKANMALYGGFAGNEEFLIHRKWTNNPSILEGDIGVQGNSSDNIQHIVNVPVAATGSLLDGFTIENAYSTSGFGGGIYIAAPMLVQNCIIQTNYCADGGGMHVERVKATVRNTIFRGNNGSHRGGALQVYGGWGQNPVFENCLFYDNLHAVVGAAMSVYHGPTTFRNCAFINNYAPDAACAFVSNYGEPWFYNCIMWDSGPNGSGVWAKKWNEYNESGSIYFYNCLMREDFVPPDPPHFGGSYLGAKENCIIGSDPLFVSEAGKDFHLQVTSPAIDAADTANSPTDDLDGNLRPGGLASDIGPYEITGGRPLAPGILFMLK